MSTAAAEGPEAASRLPGFLAAFAFRNFRLLWAGAFLSSVGTWTQDVALAWLIHVELKNPLYLGLRSFAAEMPLLAFMLLGGAVADRVDRRHILLTSNVLQMTFAAALGVLYWMGRLGIAPILLLAFLTGLAQSQSAPTYQAVLTSVVPPRFVPNAVALNSLQFNLSRAVGPVIAGVLLARVGTGPCFAVNVVSFVAVILALLRIEVPPPQATRETLRESLRLGLAHVAGNPLLSRLTLLGLAGSFLGFPLITYLPVIAGDVLGTGAAGYSGLLTSFGLGAIAGAVATAQRGHVPGRGRTALRAAALYALFALAAVTSRSQALSMAMLLLAGFFIVTAFSITNSLVQENAPEALKGRVVSIYGLAFRGGMPLGNVTAGLLAGPFGVPAVIGSFSAALLLASLALLLRDRQLRAL